jgi:L-fuculose-phosphate aldolase
MLMENHGAIAIGEDLLRAFDCMELLERAAQMSHLVGSIENSHELSEERIKPIIDMRG